MSATQQPGQLKRELGLLHAVLLGLGSILGTGVFVSIGIAAGIAGPAVLIAIVLAALLALCNGLSSAQLAAAHPVAGGTYEYGYKYLHPKLGFTAGWMFLLAKSASAATAALGVALYLNGAFLNFIPAEQYTTWWGQVSDWSDRRLFEVGLAVLFLGVVSLIVLYGVRRSAWANAVLLIVTFVGLGIFCGFVALHFDSVLMSRPETIQEDWRGFDVNALLAASSLMFVAFTGYGRIATLGEEVKNPRATIPKAIIVTLAVSALLYLFVGVAIVTAFDTWTLSLGARRSADVLTHILWHNDGQLLVIRLVAIAAITAMLGVLLNLILGLSRVLLAMGRRRDVPGLFARVNETGTTPVPAVIGVGLLIAGLTVIGDVKTTWSFSAFTVLIYYGITNLAALRLPVENRLYPRFFAYAGLGGCFFLAWWVEPIIWLVGCGLIVLGLGWHQLAPKMFGPPPSPGDRCMRCGYDLRASTGACPECGAPIPDDAVTQPPRNTRGSGA